MGFGSGANQSGTVISSNRTDWLPLIFSTHQRMCKVRFSNNHLYGLARFFDYYAKYCSAKHIACKMVCYSCFNLLVQLLYCKTNQLRNPLFLKRVLHRLRNSVLTEPKFANITFDECILVCVCANQYYISNCVRIRGPFGK